MKKLYCIKSFCKKCNAEHFLIFTKKMIKHQNFMELESIVEKEFQIINIGDNLNIKNLSSCMKYRFSCDEAIFLYFNKNGTFEKISTGQFI